MQSLGEKKVNPKRFSLRNGFLLLFYTLDGHDHFVSEWGGLSFGRWELKVSIDSNELKPKEYVYELDIRSWIDFDLREVCQRA